jgi:glycosyltransferase involved in cell wall biosynthesis
MKISIITACYNSEKYIEGCIISVLSQNYNDIEYIIIDGASKDSTLSIINKYSNKISKIISEPDKGLYDALNKGIKNSTGEYIGILNSDDYFADKKVISEIAEILKSKHCDSVIGDVKIVSPNNLNKIKRNYKANKFRLSQFKYGIMPPHSTFFCKRILYEQFGYYKIDYKIAADFELLVRFLYKNNVSFQYIPKTVTIMRDGGLSNRGFFKSKRLITKEVMKALNENNLYTNYINLNLRYLIKLKQLI